MSKSSEKSESQIHEGHKRRLRNKFLKNESLDSFYNHEILELLINFVIKRQDTNPLAHRLIAEFGSLSGVFEASFDELMKVEGVGDVTATLIKLQYELFRAYAESKYELKNQMYCEDFVAPYLRSKFLGMKYEILYVICLDARKRIINCKMVNKGFCDEMFFDMRDFMSKITESTRSVVLAHNHPSGIMKPSQSDLETTRRLEKRLREYRVEIYDHLIFTDEGWISIMNDHSFTITKVKEEKQDEKNI